MSRDVDPSPDLPSTAGTGYRAVASSLRDRISCGAFDGGRLPAEVALVEEFGVARDTIRRALALLTEEGLIRSTHGRGHYIVDGNSDAGIPRYAAVADALRERVATAALRAGDVLPSESAIQSEFEVSRTTARRALLELETRGVIERRDGRRVVRSQSA